MMPPKVQQVFDWLVDGVPGASTPIEVIERVATELNAAGVPLDRFSALVRTLHPQIAGRVFIWTPGQPVVVREAPWGAMNGPSPLRALFDGRDEQRWQFAKEPPTHPDLLALANGGLTDYFGVAMRFVSGGRHPLTWGTKAPGGFTDEQLDWLRQISKALARVAEVLALMRTAANLLSAYVGRNAGSRVLEGQVQRGEVENIACVVWFSDLRGFTSMSSSLTPKEIITVLNELFDCQVPAIDAHGGEVLKFIGDGMLAIFPFGESRDAKKACADALAASKQAFSALATLNQKRAAVGQGALRFGIGLHLGEVAYGNIGGASRLDFTCIGTTVNVASRIEGLTGKLHHDVLVSEAVALTAGFPTELVGSYELKGVEKPQPVFLPS